MAKLKANNVKELNSFFSNNDLFEMVNAYLSKNKMEYEVDDLKLRPRADRTNNLLQCGPGQQRVRIITPSGRVKYICV